MRKYLKTHEPVTSEDRLGRDVPLSEVSLPFRASVQAFSKKCGVFRVLRCSLVGLAGLIRWCTCYQHSEVQFVFMKNPWNAECIKMRAKFDPHLLRRSIPTAENFTPQAPRFQIWTHGEKDTVQYSLKQISAFVTLSHGFLAPDEGTEK